MQRNLAAQSEGRESSSDANTGAAINGMSQKDTHTHTHAHTYTHTYTHLIGKAGVSDGAGRAVEAPEVSGVADSEGHDTHPRVQLAAVQAEANQTAQLHILQPNHHNTASTARKGGGGETRVG